MKAKKTLGFFSIIIAMLFTVACENERTLKEETPLNTIDLPADYMYTLTIPEIMELSISNLNE